MFAPTGTIRRANARAQRRFRRMVDDQVYANPCDRRVKLYGEAEALLRSLNGEPDPFEADAIHEAADWRLVAMTGDYSAGLDLPDVPMAAYAEGDLRADWGNR